MTGLLLCAVLLPVLAGAGLFALKQAPDKTVKIYAFLAVLAASLVVACVLCFGTEEELCLIRFNTALSFALKADGLGRFFAGMVSFLWPFATLYAFCYLKHDENRVRYYAFYVMTYGVVLGIAFSANALTMYVFYEMLTFITLPLITHTHTREARRAGRLYLYYSLSGSSLALAGIVMMTVLTGSTAFVAGGHIAEDGHLTLLAYLFTFIGFGVKAALFPLCRWLPAASAAPTPTTALLHAVAVVKAGAFAVLRMTYFYFTPSVIKDTWAQYIAVGLAALTVIYGSCMSVKEQHFKRRFAFSTVSNLSYILLGALLCTPAGLEGALLHFVMHSVTKIGIFFCIGALMETNGVAYVYQLNGAGKTAPLTFLCFTLSGLSLIGIPPFCGFISKYYLIDASLSDASVSGAVAAGAVILSAVLTAAYVLSVAFRAYVRTPNEHALAVREPDKGFVCITGVFAAFALLLGIFGQGTVDVISRIVGGIIL